MGIKQETSDKLLYTLILIVNLCLLALVGFFIFKIIVIKFDLQTDFPYREDPFLLLTILLSGVIGFLGSVEIFVFPFFPLVLIGAVVYFIVSLLYKTKARLFLKKYLKKITIFSLLLLIIIIPTSGYIDDSVRKEQEKQDAYYLAKYVVDEKVVFPYKLIGSNSVKIEIYGEDLQIEKEIDVSFYKNNENRIHIMYPSHNGKYFLGTADDDSVIMSIDSQEVLVDIKKLLGKQIRPIDCRWSPDDKFLACFNGFFTGKILDSIIGVGSQEAGLALILFDVKNKQSKELYSKVSYPYPRNYFEKTEGFSWSDNSNVIYADMDSEIYKIDNIWEMSESGYKIDPHIVKLKNMHSCRMLVYDKGAIYCSVKAGDIGKNIEDSKNRNIKEKEVFVIVQNINQKSPDDYKVINRVPFKVFPQLFIIDDTYISVESMKYVRGMDFIDNFVININTGKIVKDPPEFGSVGRAQISAIWYYGE